jgi:cell wall-associated NlpC family hydrolase
MNGTEYVVEDTGPLNRYGVTFDVYYDDHATAQAHGHQTWEAFLADDNGSGSVEITETVTERVLTAVVKNEGIAAAMGGFHLTDLQQARYELLLETKGNRESVFPPDIYTDLSEGDFTDYHVPPEALSDTAFAGMLREAERYLGLPYVWGGSSPETGFDCSGFVSWVINHSGNGWNVGRQTAEGLRQACAYVPPSEARPGDLVFFRGTYDTAGASHVGIYVGNGMMIHCGHPVQYASIETDYWRAHFYQYGRIG